MMRKFFAIGLVLAIAGMIALEPQNTTEAQVDSETVLVRLVHGVPLADEVDIYADGALVAAGVGFAEATPHIAFPSGQHTFAIRGAGDAVDAEPVHEGSISLQATSNGFRHATIVIQGDSEGATSLGVYEDLLSPVRLGNSRFHAIHAIAGLDPVDIVTTSGGTLLPAVTFNGTEGGTIDPPVISFELLAVPTGGTVEDALVEIGQVNLNTGLLTTVLLLGTPDEPTSLVLQAPTLPDPGVDTVLTSIAHGSIDAPVVDIYADEVIIWRNLEPGSVTPHVPMPAGDVALAVREAGTPGNSEAAFEGDVNISSATGAATLTALGSLTEGDFSFSIQSDDIGSIDPESARVVVINTNSEGPTTVEVGEETVADGLSAFTTSEPVDVEKGVYTVSGSVDSADGPVSFELTEQEFAGGTYNTILVYLTDDASLDVNSTRVNVTTASLPGSSGEVVVAAEPTAAVTEEVPAIEETPAAPTIEATVPPATTPESTTPPPPPPAATTIAPPDTGNQLLGLVNLNAGANLQCREYPAPTAFSLGLIPNGTTVLINGYAGPDDPEEGQLEFVPYPEGQFDEPTLAEDFEEIWLNINWNSETGGINCWSRADFFRMSYRNRAITEVEDFFALELVEIFPRIIRPIPANYPGGVTDETAIIVPPTPPRQDPVATVELDTDVSLHLRRLPDTDAESLALIPNGAQMFALERTEVAVIEDVGEPDVPDWLFVEYTNENGETFNGWVSAQYITLSFQGRAYAVENLPEADEIEVGGRIVVENALPPSTAPSAATAAPPPASTTGLLGQVININVGSNLNLRDQPNAQARVIASIPANSQMLVLGRSAIGDWLNVRYEIAGEGTFIGWVSANFVQVTRNGTPVTIQDVNVIETGNIAPPTTEATEEPTEPAS
ncbi:MAG: DUF4397 domain-containing protein [Chloroflexi bacterium]|nr:DUF4397 domain-containing protein [Chloroflexota bacterium]